MIDQYVLATNDDGDLAIRTVSATESSSVTDTTSVITATDDGKLAVRVVGGGGSDQHNLGYYADLTALQTAYPTGTDGDFAILGSTDTIWVWDSGTSAWKDTDTKGQVTSVNNKTGAVTLTASDVGAATSAQGAKADTAVQPGDLATVATTGAYSDLTGAPTIPAAQVNSDWNASSGVAEILNKPTIPAAIQVSTMPTAAVGELDKIYQFVGATDASYTHGYFYECVSDGGTPATYSWTQTDVQPQAGGLPSQSGNSGKFLTTDGTDASWSDRPLTNSLYNSTQSIGIGSYANAGNYAVCVGRLSTSGNNGIAIGYKASNTNGGGVVVGKESYGANNCIIIGPTATTQSGLYDPSYSIAIGVGAKVANYGNIQLGPGTNNYATAGCFNVALAKKNETTNNYRLLDYNGTIPTDRWVGADATTPSADGTYVPTLTISSGVATRTWGAAASAPVVPATMPTLAVADWSSNTQTVNVTGVTASNIVFVSPAPASAADYATAGIVCTAQGSGTLTFTCTTVPSNAITVNVVILG